MLYTILKAACPVIQATDVLIQVKSSAVSNSDKRLIAGDLSHLRPITNIPGCEVSGTIEKIGNSVQGFAVGDEIVAVLPLDVGGGFAEQVSVPAELICMFE